VSVADWFNTRGCRTVLQTPFASGLLVFRSRASIAGAVARSLRSPVRRATLGSVAAGVAAQGALVISGILSARMLGPTDRGYLALIILIPSTVAQLGSLGISLATTYFIARQPSSARAVVSLVRRPAFAQIAVLTAIHVIVVLFLIAGKPDRFTLAALISLGSVPASYAVEYGLAILQGTQRFAVFNLLRIVPTAAYAGVLVVLVLLSAGSLTIVFTASLMATIGTGALALGSGLASLRGRDGAAEAPTRRDLLRFGLGSYLGYVSPIESLRLDQLYVGAVFPPATLGIYVVATAFTNLSRMVGQSIGLIAAPHVASLPEGSEQRRAAWRFFLLATVLCGGVTLVLILTVQWLTPLLFGHQFASAGGLAQVLVLGAFFLAIRRTLTDGARGCGLPALGSLAEAAAAAWFVPAVLLLSGPLDDMGVAVAWTSAVAFGFAVLLVRFAMSRPAEADEVEPQVRAES
jgi:O-antigen/teichoic acid export membrane protein